MRRCAMPRCPPRGCKRDAAAADAASVAIAEEAAFCWLSMPSAATRVSGSSLLGGNSSSESGMLPATSTGGDAAETGAAIDSTCMARVMAATPVNDSCESLSLPAAVSEASAAAPCEVAREAAEVPGALRAAAPVLAALLARADS